MADKRPNKGSPCSLQCMPMTSKLPVVKNIHLERYDYSGLCDSGLTSIILGMPARGTASSYWRL